MTALGWEHQGTRDRKRIKLIAELCLDLEYPDQSPGSMGFAGLDKYRKVFVALEPAYMRFLKRKLD